MADHEHSENPDESPISPKSGDDAPTRVSPRSAIERVGSRIGRYKLLQEIGEGGFGVVYMAEQSKPVKRRVALKIVKPGMDSREIVARFEAERQALAMMDHPNIATVLDAGETDTGRPYFVMELVKGVPLLKFCDRNKYGTERRLRLFLDVCAAIQHAHQKGVIHRDIKPSNILVTLHDGEPVVKVIDFGIAKALQHELTEKTLFTAYGQMIGTPQYMSPEQAEMSGLDIDTRSDIYSLGVVLYELLTGSTPLDPRDLRTAGYEEIQRRICQETPRKPSTRVHTLSQEESTCVEDARGEPPEKIGRMVRGDLDWIVMKALEKDRDRRFDTAKGLSNDIHRFLNDEPVLASPPTMFYLATKFAQRHKGWLTAAAIVTVILLVASVGMTILYFRAEADRVAEAAASKSALEQSDRASAERDRAVAAEKVAASALDTAEARREESELAKKAGAEQRALAEFNAARAEKEARQALAGLYTADVQLMAKGWEDPGESAQSVEMKLFSHWPIGEARDFRDFAWRLQWNELHRGALSSSIHTGLPRLGFTEMGNLVTLDRGLHCRKWDADGRELVSEFRMEEARRRSIRLVSPEGDRVAVGDSDSIQLISIESGEEMARFDPPRPISQVLFVGRTGRVATFSDDNRLLLWEAGSATPVRSHDVSEFRIGTAVASGDGHLIVMVNQNKRGRIGILNTGSGAIRSVKISGRIIRALAVSGDGSRVMVCANNGKIVIWNTNRDKASATFEAEGGGVTALALSGDGGLAAVGGENGDVSVWGSVSGGRLRWFRGHLAGIRELVFSPDGKQLASGCDSGVAKVWDLEAGAASKPKRSKPFYKAVYSPDGAWLAAVGTKATRLWNVRERRWEREIPFGGFAAAFSPDSQLLLIGNPDPVANKLENDYFNRVWLMKEMREGEPIPAGGVPGAMAFSPDGSLLAIGAGNPLISRQAGVVQNFDGRQVRISIRDVNAGEKPMQLGGHTDNIVALRFTPDGRRLVSAGRDGLAIIWDTATWATIRTIRESSQGLSSAAVSPDGTTIALGGLSNNQINLWELETGKHLKILERHNDVVTGLQFSDDGQTLVSASLDGTVKLWNMETLVETRRLKAGSAGVNGLSFSPDGQELAAAGVAGDLRIWRAPSLEEIADDALTLRGLSHRAKRYGHSGESDRALALFKEVLERQKRVLGATHPDTIVTLNSQGGSMNRMKDYAGAAASWSEAARNGRLAGTDVGLAGSLRNNAMSAYLREAAVRRDKNDLQGEIEILELALADARLLLEPDDSRIFSVLMNIGAARLKRDEFSAAASRLREALDLRREHAPDELRGLAETLELTGRAEAGLGESGRAIGMFREAIEVRRRQVAPDPNRFGATLCELAGALILRGGEGIDEAEALLLECEKLSTGPARTRTTALALAEWCAAKGDRESAQRWKEQAQRYSPPVSSFGKDAPVDALKLLDLEAQVIDGDWKREKGAIVVAGGDVRARVQLPFHPAAEYRLRIDVRRVSESGTFGIGILCGENRALVTIDDEEQMSSLAWIGDLRAGDQRNPTRARNGKLSVNEPTRIECVVRPGFVEVHAGGVRLFEWKGDPELLALPPKWRTDKPVVFIGGSRGAEFCVTRWEYSAL